MMTNASKISSSPIPYSFIPSESEQDNPNKLFLGGISADTTEKQLEEFFSQFGKVKDVRIVTDRVTAACKGYGFVTFEDNEDVENLVEKKTIRMNGTKLRVRKAIRRNASQFEHVSPSKKWMMLPSNTMNKQQAGSAFLTPPNTPPAMDQISEMKTQFRFMYNSTPQHHHQTFEGFPILLPNNLTRSRTNSSPPTATLPTYGSMQPQMFIPEDERVFFPHQQPRPLVQQAPTYPRERTYSLPVTINDFNTLQGQKYCHEDAAENIAKTLLIPTNLNGVPQKLFNSTVARTPNPPFESHANQFLVPCYQGVLRSSENVVYCMQQPTTVPLHSNPSQPNNGVVASNQSAFN